MEEPTEVKLATKIAVWLVWTAVVPQRFALFSVADFIATTRAIKIMPGEGGAPSGLRIGQYFFVMLAPFCFDL